MNLQESIRRILKEVRVPRNERVELYKDNNIIVVVPLTHRALQKYANQCQWCINSDLYEWEDYHKGIHAVIIQRNPKKPKIGITGNPVASELFLLDKLEQNRYDVGSFQNILDYQFKDRDEMMEYFQTIGNEISDFATNIVYYSPINGLFDQEDNYLPSYGYSISDIPNVTPEVIKIMDDYLQRHGISIQESIRRILKEETNPKKEKLLKLIEREGLYTFTQNTGLIYNDIYHRIGELPREVKIQYLKDVINDLEQTPGELDLTFITGSIPLYENDDWQMVYVEFLSNEDDILKVHVYAFGEDWENEYDTIIGDEIDNETLDILVTELSEKLQHDRKRF